MKVNSDPEKIEIPKNRARYGVSSSTTTSNKRTLKNFFDRKSYFVGMSFIRRSKNLKRNIKNTISKLQVIFSDVKKAVVCSCKVFAVKNGLNLDEVTSIYDKIVSGSKRAYDVGPLPLVKYWIRTFTSGTAQLLYNAIRSPNYLMPIFASVAFLFSVLYTTNINYALQVTYNGEPIGYIKDESVFEEAQKQMQGRIIFEEYIRPDDSIPQFALAAVNDKQIANTNQLTNLLIKASGNELAEGYGLYIDNRFMGAVTDRKLIQDSLSQMLDSYRSGDPKEIVEFDKSPEIRGGLYPVTSIADAASIQQQLRREEVSKQVYTAQTGDAPVTIAQKNNITFSQLKALNPDIEKKLLVGQEIVVTKSVPLLGVKVTKEISYEEETPFKVNQVQDTSKYQGYVKITQKGKKGSNLIVAKVTYVDGLETEREVLSMDVKSQAINEVVVVGGKTPLATIPASAQNTSSNFIWPVDGGYVSCGINGYRGHTGMDIAANSGTAVRAAASGTVVLAKNTTTGYGRHIIIDHGGGMQTLYGHNSVLKVTVGQWVEQGQLIALVGRTGRASGNHLHFEVRSNGRYLDPAKYIGKR